MATRDRFRTDDDGPPKKKRKTGKGRKSTQHLEVVGEFRSHAVQCFVRWLLGVCNHTLTEIKYNLALFNCGDSRPIQMCCWPDPCIQCMPYPPNSYIE